jgi:high-affinity Fe2+/Pb2+ permease
MAKSHWLAFAAYTVILLSAAAIDAATALPRWLIGLAAVLLVVLVGGAISLKRRK